MTDPDGPDLEFQIRALEKERQLIKKYAHLMHDRVPTALFNAYIEDLDKAIDALRKRVGKEQEQELEQPPDVDRLERS